MSRIFDWLVEFWDWLRRLMGFDRLRRSKRDEELAGRSRLARIFYLVRPLVALFALAYFVLLITRFAIIYGDDLQYPQRVLSTPTYIVNPGDPMPDGAGCAPSQVVAVQAYILDVMVNQNTWAPMDPQFKIGWFGLLDFEPTPFFDNKAAFQMGALRAVRRMSVELADLLGRARRTTAPDRGLISARANVQFNERTWLINPLSPNLPLVSTTAASQFRNAIAEYHDYNRRLMACDSTFDTRSDNLFVLLDRLAADVAGYTDELTSRSRGTRWDLSEKAMVPGQGNNLGFFDMQADNLFYSAHGMMWAYHGLLQAMRIDFGAVIQQANLTQVWDRMEIHAAESAALEPLIVSNGREDSLFQPDHLAAMAVNMLRAQQNMVELREILNR